MVNEKRLIDANALNAVIRGIAKNIKRPSAVELMCLCQIAEQPTVDAVEVVRCKDCRYWNPRYETMGMCMKHNSIVTFTKPDFFCAWGKDKNDGICKED